MHAPTERPAQPIDGHTELIAHIGFPTHAFKAPLIYNPYFEQARINARVVPFACRPEHFSALLPALFSQENVRGALITMPHKASVLRHLVRVAPAAQIAGACNAVRRGADGQLEGDMFDGAGFVRGVQRKGWHLPGMQVLVVGTGGVGSAISASLAGAGVSRLRLFDLNADSCRQLADRLRTHYQTLDVQTGSNDPDGCELIVNATPLGMNEGDALPVDGSRIAPTALVGEVVMRQRVTAFLAAASARGCRVQVGSDMLYEQIPAYLEFFGYPTTTAEHLRSLSLISA